MYIDVVPWCQLSMDNLGVATPTEKNDSSFSSVRGRAWEALPPTIPAFGLACSCVGNHNCYTFMKRAFHSTLLSSSSLCPEPLQKQFLCRKEVSGLNVFDSWHFIHLFIDCCLLQKQTPDQYGEQASSVSIIENIHVAI